MKVNEVKCYAFRDVSKGCEELMEKHVKDIIEMIRSRWEFRGLIRKLSKMLNVEEGLIEDFFYIAALLHDFGKMLEEYQSRCREEGCSFFPKHYEISARFVLNVAYRAGILSPEKIEERVKKLFDEGDFQKFDEGDIFILAVLTPIFLHNYAHLDEKKLDEGYLEPKAKLDEGCRRLMLKLIEWLNGFAKSDSARKLLEVLRDELANKEVVLSVLPLSRDVMLSYKATFGRAVAEAFTGLINICDGLVAYRNRKGVT